MLYQSQRFPQCRAIEPYHSKKKRRKKLKYRGRYMYSYYNFHECFLVGASNLVPGCYLQESGIFRRCLSACAMLLAPRIHRNCAYTPARAYTTAHTLTNTPAGCLHRQTDPPSVYLLNTLRIYNSALYLRPVSAGHGLLGFLLFAIAQNK